MIPGKDRQAMDEKATYILVRDGSAASSDASRLLEKKGVAFRAITSDACDRIAPSLLGSREVYSGLEEISRFLNQISS